MQVFLLATLFFLPLNFAFTGSSVDLFKRIPGIWKLEIENLSPGQETRTIAQQLKEGRKKDDNTKSVLIKLQEDGFFRQCDEGYQEGRWISGRFNATDTTIQLAMDRQYYGPPHDTLLVGEIDVKEENTNEETEKRSTQAQSSPSPLTFTGSVVIGKFHLPKKDPSFFEEEVLQKKENIGTFKLSQVLSIVQMFSGKGRKTNDVSSATRVLDGQQLDLDNGSSNTAFQ